VSTFSALSAFSLGEEDVEDEGALRRRDLTDSMLLLLLLRIGRLDEWLLSGLELRFLLKLVVDPLRYKQELRHVT
jgi:hypothetical protein